MLDAFEKIEIGGCCAILWGATELQQSGAATSRLKGQEGCFSF